MLATAERRDRIHIGALLIEVLAVPATQALSDLCGLRISFNPVSTPARMVTLQRHVVTLLPGVVLRQPVRVLPAAAREHASKNLRLLCTPAVLLLRHRRCHSRLRHTVR